MSVIEYEFDGGEPRTEKRSAARQAVELKAIVQVKSGEDGDGWKEVAVITSLSRNGAGFTTTQPCGVGRLLSLTMPLDPELRMYDKMEKVYQVFAVVQFCNKATFDGGDVFHLGVGFIGKMPPESYIQDSDQAYRIIGMNANGLWRLIESAEDFKPRKTSRFWISLPMSVSLLKGRSNTEIQREECETQNISIAGVSVPCSLELAIGDRVKVASKEYGFYAFAIVRNRKERKGLPPTVHLEFVDQRFPMSKVLLTGEPSVSVV